MGSLGSAGDKKQVRAAWRCLAAGPWAETIAGAEPCGSGQHLPFTERSRQERGQLWSREKSPFGLVSASVAKVTFGILPAREPSAFSAPAGSTMKKTHDCFCTKLLVTVTLTLSHRWPGQQELSSYSQYPMMLGFPEGCLKCVSTRQDEGQKSLSFQFSSLSKLR